MGDASGARPTVDETAALTGTVPDTVDWLLDAETSILLAEDEADVALERALALLREVRERGGPKDVAAQVWWVARVLGAEAVGGAEEMESARGLLASLHAEMLLREPDLAPGVATLRQGSGA